MTEASPSSAAGACALCGTRLGPLAPEGRFCCPGCLHVSRILAAAPPVQARRILEQARRLGIVPAQPLPAPPAWLEPEREGSPPGRLTEEEGIAQERFLVTGFVCPSCAWLVGSALTCEPGVRLAEADFLSDSVRVEYDMRRTSPETLGRSLARLGYGLEPLLAGRTPEETAFRRLASRFALALFLALNVMMLSAVHWATFLEAVPELDLRAVAVIQLVLCTPLIFLGVWPLARRSLRLIRHGRASMDLLFVLGFGAAFGLSLAALLGHDSGHRYYFDSCAAFVAIALFGQLVEGRVRLRAARSARGLLSLAATKALKLDPQGSTAFAPLEGLVPGDVIQVDADQIVPLDGVLESESAGVSEAMLTGESTPVPKAAGEPVWAGSRVMGGGLRLRVARPFRQSRLAQIAEGIAQALTRAELRLRAADRLAAWFVPLVVLLAAVTFLLRLLWAGGGDPWAPAIWLPAISVLLVACPCAFGIASATALAVAVSALLDRGVLVKDAAVLEALATADRVVFDKTGTLTRGIWRVEALGWFGPADPALLGALLAAERGVDHPVAHALASWQPPGPRPPAPARVESREEVPGRGLMARIGGRELRVGSPGLFEFGRYPEDLAEDATCVLFGWGARAAGWLLLRDALRPEAGAVVARLRELGLEPALLSGDRPELSRAVARALGIPEAQGGLDPEQKRAWVAERARTGARILYVGDGSNDGPPMAEAAVAVALRHGADLSLQTAQILPLAADLEILPGLVRAARLTRRAMRVNFAWAFGYNAAFLPLAAFGWLHPIFAALLMAMSSTTVLLLSLRLRGKIVKQGQGLQGRQELQRP